MPKIAFSILTSLKVDLLGDCFFYILLIFFLFLFLNVYEYLLGYAYVYHVCILCLKRPEEGISSPRAGVPRGCEPLDASAGLFFLGPACSLVLP